MRTSSSARRSFEMELGRLHGMSIEDRIAEALSLKDRFAWLKPTPSTRYRLHGLEDVLAELT